MGKTRLLAVAACVAAVVGVSANAALAGEVTGNGKTLWTNTDKWNAEHTLHGKSACAFSGQEDTQFAGTPGNLNPDYDPNAGHSQSWGQIARGAQGALGGVPGTACNPTKSSGEPG